MRPLAITLAGLLLFTAACGGGDDPAEPGAQPGTTASAPSADGGGGKTPNDVPSLNPKTGAPDLPQPTETGPVAAAPQPKQVTKLVGTWKGSSPADDFFTFDAKGRGIFKAGGEELWKGTVIPSGKRTFRLSWQGHDPGVTYWQIELAKDGASLTFAANQQVYEKVTKKK
ncbi:hypothetical protein GCM10027589_46980 [Actinocorallia lasiicapitis]